MCILFIHTNPDPQENEYRLIVATNRDEFYSRPAKSAFQCPDTGFIGGRDMEPGREGGTWLGFRTKKYPENGKSTKHCFSCLTNIAGPKLENPMGRGRLVIDYLESASDYTEYVTDLRKKELQYNGYNLVAVELSKDGRTSIYHHSNLPQIDSVYNGKHTIGFGNSGISAPQLKVLNGRNNFLEIIDRGLNREELKEELVALLKDKTKYIPDKKQGKDSTAAEKVSSIYVDFVEAGYGTRTHTVVLVDKKWNLEFTEITMEEPIDPEKPKWKTTEIKSQL